MLKDQLSKDNPTDLTTITFLVGDSYKPSFTTGGFVRNNLRRAGFDDLFCRLLDRAVLHMQLPNLRMQLAAAGQRQESHSIR